MWGDKKLNERVKWLEAAAETNQKRVDILIRKVAEMDQQLTDTNTRLSRVSLATGLVSPEIYREKAQ